ncbi:MAG: class I SAM-dependent methyltransferase [Oligoflexia bacterium]|nr:class I SAM-dependent methyltransferase [Oligoflexia bacterium]
MKKKKLSNSWHKKLYGPIHARENINAPIYHKSAKKEAQFLIQFLKLDQSQTILDAPCGTGRHTLAFGKKGFSVTGVDINDLCLKLAKKIVMGLKRLK